MASKLAGTRKLSVILTLSRLWGRRLSAARIGRLWRVLYPRWSEEDRDTQVQGLVEAMQQPSRGLNGLFESRKDWSLTLRELPMPTLLLTSEKGMIKPAERDTILAALPDGHNVHVPGAAHNIQRDSYEAFMKALLEFSGVES